jgi:AcrR family transcriptional regulator
VPDDRRRVQGDVGLRHPALDVHVAGKGPDVPGASRGGEQDTHANETRAAAGSFHAGCGTSPRRISTPRWSVEYDARRPNAYAAECGAASGSRAAVGVALTRMSEIVSEQMERFSRPRRADAERSIAAILDAAAELLAARPGASMAEIATAAGVARQTVYTHFPAREALVTAVARRALAEALAAIDAAEPERGEPVDALERLTTAWWGTAARHARVLEALAAAGPGSAAANDLPAPVLERLEALAERGRRAGVFARDVPAGWLAAAFLGLMHAAADEIAAGRIDAAAAGRAVERSVPRVFGVGP